MSGNFIYRHHVEPRVKLYSPREESFPIPLEHIDVSRITKTNLDVMQESRIDDYWNIDGSRDLSGSWTGFTQFTLKWEPSRRIFLVQGVRLTKRQAASLPDHLWPELWRGVSKNAKLREKHKWAIDKPKLDNARRLRGIYFVDPEDMEFKEIILNARRKLETPTAPAMPCKICKKNKHGEARSKTDDFKSKFACLLEASESTRMRMEETLPKYHEDHIAGKGDSSLRHYNMVYNLFLYLKQWRYPQQKQQWIKNGKTWKDFGVGQNKSQKQIWRDWWSKKRRKKSTLRFIDGPLSFEECRIGDKAPKKQISSRTPGRHWERWFWILCSIHWTRIINVTNDGSKGHGYQIQTTRMRRTSSRRSICLYPSENGRCTDVIKKSKVRMSRYLDTSTKAQMAKIMVQYGRSSRSSWTKSVRSSFGRIIITGKATRENPPEIRLGESSQLGMLIRTPHRVFVSSPSRTRVKSEKNIAILKNMTERHTGWSRKDWNSRSKNPLAVVSRWGRRTECAWQMEELEHSGQMEENLPWDGCAGLLFERKESTWNEIRKESAKRETELYKMREIAANAERARGQREEHHQQNT